MEQGSLFGNEPVKMEEKANNTPLPLIPLSKKRPSKNDTPLEKEVRRFNKLIKELHEHEEEAKKKQEYQNVYDGLYQQLVIPQLRKMAEAKYEYITHLHSLFEQGKFTKSIQKKFTELMIELLEDVSEYIIASGSLMKHYLNKQVQLMSKKEKERFNDMMEQEGYEIDINDYDVEDTWRQNKERAKENFSKAHAHFFEGSKNVHREQKKQQQEKQDVNALYRELARTLHPDLEQDENIRHQKEQLMKELTEARQKGDLYTMLMIKMKAQQNWGEKQSDKNEPYTLQQLKNFNKELKKKVDKQRGTLMMDMINGMAMNMSGIITNIGHGSNPQAEIDLELKEIARAIKLFKSDINKISSPEDIHLMLEPNDRY